MESIFKNHNDSPLPKRYQADSDLFKSYWERPIGQAQLKKLKSLPTTEEIEQFSRLYMETDTKADGLMELEKTLGPEIFHPMVDQAIEKGIENVPDAPEALKKIFKDIDTVPEWLDKKKAAKGAALCRKAGINGLLVLRNYCLMGGYTSEAINKPLVFTGALNSGATRRLGETLNFWVDIIQEDGLGRFSPGYRSAVKVRIIHAIIRQYIYRNPEWKDEEWGKPINKADEIATNLAFSLVFLEGLRMLNIPVSKEEEEGLFHFWKYAGYLLGMDPAHLPDTEEEAIKIMYCWTMTQAPSVKDASVLAKALVFEPYELYKSKSRAWMDKELNLSFCHFFLPKDFFDRLQIPTKSPLSFLPNLFRTINSLFYSLEKVPGLDRMVDQFGSSRQKVIRKTYLQGVRATYRPKMYH